MFVWRFLDGSGAAVGSSEAVADRAAAEAWLSDAWVDLAGRGVLAVELVDLSTGEMAYRMSLADD